MQEYIDLGHMTLTRKCDNDGYYMPHHAVIKPSSNTTKVRVVFDASARTQSGESLNNLLMVGPTIQDKIFEHLVRFRTHKFVITADIEKMYRQVLLHPDDRRYQRIFWYHKDEIQTFQLNTVTFGVSSAPFLAIRTIHQLADDEFTEFPRASEILKRDLYVDDLLTGADSINEICVIRDEIIKLLKRGGFNIRQWASNDKRALDGIPEISKNMELLLDGKLVPKTLGITWNANSDQLLYKVQAIPLGVKFTKRNILSEIAKIFDPLGMLGPVILYAKGIMQRLWKAKITWDESVPSSIHSAWQSFAAELNLINDFTIDRKLLIENSCDVQIHGFCDASNAGYGACLYVRSTDKHGKVSIQLLCAKSRVAPVTTLTTPRGELCGAVILTRLYNEANRAFSNLSVQGIYFWCDSTIVLHWIKTTPNLLNTFVANRVSEIQKNSDMSWWRHVRSNENPADSLSRGQLPSEFLKNKIWLQGPPWLKEPKDSWPINIVALKQPLPELKRNICLSVTTMNREIFDRFSSYSKLLRVVAYCLRMRCTNVFRGELSAVEIQEAELRVLRLVQQESFSDEIQAISQTGHANKTKIAALSPFLDENRLLRVGGRLKHANIPTDSKHPILLPAKHPVTRLILRETHLKQGHAGVQMTLYTTRLRFWIIDGKNQTRHVIRKCLLCTRFRADSVKYKMADLPKARVQQIQPFQATGVDFCGPFLIKEKKHRNRNTIKTYVCIFICMATKAIHLEVVSDLTTSAFLAALSRFVSRRGVPSNIYSDNGTNFVGANNELRELHKSDEFGQAIKNFSLEKRIIWHFNPPLAPHFGGLWEAAVKSFKKYFKRVVGDKLFTFEEINTFAIEIEAILNSRPLSTISSDPNDPLAITPAHLLIGQPLTCLPQKNLSFVPENRLTSWRLITKIRQDFWKRWHSEYLCDLQRRQRWTQSHTNIQPGTIVLLKDKNQPCMRWAMGRIVKVHPGSDGVVRTATVRTASTEYKRCVQLLCPLPTDNEL